MQQGHFPLWLPLMIVFYPTLPGVILRESFPALVNTGAQFLPHQAQSSCTCRRLGKVSGQLVKLLVPRSSNSLGSLLWRSPSGCSVCVPIFPGHQERGHRQRDPHDWGPSVCPLHRLAVRWHKV